MLNELTHLYRTSRIAQVGLEAAALYSYMRIEVESAQNKTTSELWFKYKKCCYAGDFQSIGLPNLRISLVLSKLVQCGWVKQEVLDGQNVVTLMEDGVWFIHSAPEAVRESESDKIRKQAEMDSQRIASLPTPVKERIPKAFVEVSDEIASSAPIEIVQARLNRFYCTEYERVFNERPGFMSVLKERAHG